MTNPTTTLQSLTCGATSFLGTELTGFMFQSCLCLWSVFAFTSLLDKPMANTQLIDFQWWVLDDYGTRLSH